MSKNTIIISVVIFFTGMFIGEIIFYENINWPELTLMTLGFALLLTIVNTFRKHLEAREEARRQTYLNKYLKK